ncbi:hypothetical protein BU16DRAFT_238248 [Lophium mytilinum]|uniref:Uncharacterized protein n=1 Tax=Lophium mytilinum TaxID=390894 RepID=A0A6A6R5Y2_9PEZI|nr:hypothetical protein BU16DRAFT_238248 [Lophium mytilinum]
MPRQDRRLKPHRWAITSALHGCQPCHADTTSTPTSLLPTCQIHLGSSGCICRNLVPSGHRARLQGNRLRTPSGWAAEENEIIKVWSVTSGRFGPRPS